MARKSRQSILKRQRELKRLEKAALKRQKREERRRNAAEDHGQEHVDGAVDPGEDDERLVPSIAEPVGGSPVADSGDDR